MLDRTSIADGWRMRPARPQPDSRPVRLGAWPGYAGAISWTLVGVSAAWQLAQYLQCAPLGDEEATLAASLIGRGFWDVTTPLNDGPVLTLFLWAELSVTKLLGVSPMTLRLFPLLCGVAGLLLVRHLAGRLLPPAVMLLAVGGFSLMLGLAGCGLAAGPFLFGLLLALLLTKLAERCWRRDGRSKSGDAIAGFPVT